MSNEPLLPTSHSRPSRLGARRISPQTSIGEATGSGASRGADQGLPLPNLSDKAKGKRRATFKDEDHTDIDSDSKADGGIKEEDRGRSVTFRFTGDEEYSTGDLDVWVDAGETVGRVKDKMKSLRPSLQLHPLKFIHSGRLLTDGTLLLPYIRALEDRYRTAQTGLGLGVGLGEVGWSLEGASEKGKNDRTEEEKVLVHCVVGSKQKEEDGNEEGGSQVEEEDAPPQQTRPRGFDALLDAGLTRTEIDQMRRQFYAGRGEEVPDGLDADDEHTRALEEQWIEGDLTSETAQTVTEGLYTSILTGLLFGFLFPITPWFFFREIPAPNFFEPLEAESDRSPSGLTSINATGATTRAGTSSGREGEGDLDWSMGMIPTVTSAQTAATAARSQTAGLSESADPSRNRGFFGLRGRAGGDWIAGVVFGQRVQMAILIGTVLNVGFGAFRFMV